MFVAKLPGSTYATEATNAGPSIASVARSRPRRAARSSGLGRERALARARPARRRRRRPRGPARGSRRAPASPARPRPASPAPARRRARARASPKRTNSGPSNGCLSTTSSRSPGAIPRSARNRSISGIGVGHPRERPARADLERLQADRRALLDRQLPGRDRVAVRVVGGVAELGRDQLLELLGEHVLEHLGLRWTRSHGTPSVLTRYSSSSRWWRITSSATRRPSLGQRHAAVGLVLDQAELAEALDHARGRRRRDAEALGERVRADRLAVAALERVDRLRVVLDAGERIGCRVLACHTEIMVRLNLNFASCGAYRRSACCLSCS